MIARTSFRSFMIHLLVFFFAVDVSAKESAYEKFQKKAEDHRVETTKEGMSYMVGGSLALVTSLTLSIDSQEVFPKIGYSLIHTLSSAAIAYGAILYYTGDEFTREAEKLKDFNESVQKISNLSPEQKQRLVDETTYSSYLRAKERRATAKRIRGILELVSAASSGTTLAFSKTRGAATGLTLGFIILISTVGGITDLLSSDDPSHFQEVFTSQVDPVNQSVSVGLNFKF